MPDSVRPARVRVNGIEIYLEEHGDGFPVLLIMGLGANLDWWDPRLVQGLSETWRTVLFDNRDVGRSDRSPGEYTIGSLAEDAAGLLTAQGISRAHVLGISMGGMIAQELALSHPEKVERLVLCSTYCGGTHAIRPSPSTLRTMMQIAGAGTPEEAARLTVSLCFTPEFAQANPEGIERWVKQVLRSPTPPESQVRQLQAIAAFDTFDRLPGIRSPTLVLHGKRDILIPPGNAPILAHAIPGASLHVLEHSAHGLAEDLDEAVRIIRGFLLDTGQTTVPGSRGASPGTDSIRQPGASGKA